MTWLESFFDWIQHSIGLSPALQQWLLDILGEVGEENPWMISLWQLFQQVIAMFFSLAPLAPAIFLFMAVSAVLLALDKFSPDPIIDFVLMLYNFTLSVIGVIAAVVDMVIPF